MTDDPDEETIRVRRSRARAAVPDEGALDAGALDETVPVASRAAAAAPLRRRATYVDGVAADDRGAAVSPEPSRARAAAAASDRVYRARPAEPVIVPRAVASRRTAQAAVDGAVLAAQERQRARRSALIVVSAASAVAFAAAVSLAAIALNP